MQVSAGYTVGMDEPAHEWFVRIRARSFVHAGRGFWIFVKTTHNAWIHLAVLAIVVALGLFFNLSLAEWIPIIFAAGLVLVAEEFNTAIEIDLNLTSPEIHPHARDAKDVAAGAVLVSAAVAAIIGVVIFAPHMAKLAGTV